MESERDSATRRSAAGFTLMETLITVVIVSTVVLAGAMAFVGMQRSTAADSIRVRMDLALSAYSEALKAVPFVACASTTTPSYVGVAWAPPNRVAASIDGVAHYRGTKSAMTSCVVGSGQDSRQVLSLTVTSGGRSITADIVKRAPGACPDSTCSW